MPCFVPLCSQAVWEGVGACFTRPDPGWRPGCPESLGCGRGQVGLGERPAV